MNKGIWLIFGIFLVLALSQNASALTYIDSCQTLSSNNDYALNASIATDTSGSCLNLSSGGNITLDGSGFSITMNGTGSVLSFQNTENVSITGLNISVTSSPSQTIVLLNANNTAITNSVAKVMNCSTVKRLFNRDFHGDGISLIGNNFSVCGNLWSGLGDINIDIIGNNWLVNCSAITAGGFGTFADISGKYVNFSYNNVEAYCDNNTAGSFYFTDLNDSYVGFDTYIGHGKMYEPFTFHRNYRNVIENLVINTTDITDFGTGMTGRFCCGTDNIFRNSKLYLNKPLNIYAVNYIGNNITWDNIEDNCYGTCGMVIHDYDNVTIKNSVFSGNTITISGKSVSPVLNILYNLHFQNVTMNKKIRVEDAGTVNHHYIFDYLNLNVSTTDLAMDVFNVSNLLVMNSNFKNTGTGRALYFRNNNNITANNLSIILPTSSSSTSFGFDVVNATNVRILNSFVSGKGFSVINATNVEILNNTFVGGVYCFHNNIANMTISGNVFNKTANIGGGYDTYIVQFGSSGTNGFVNDSVISGNTLSSNSSGVGISFVYARTKNIDVGYNFIRTVGNALGTGSFFNATHMSESYGYFRMHDNNIITSNGSYSAGVCLFIYATGETLNVIAENNNMTCGGSYGIYVQLDAPSRTGKNVSSILFRGNRYNLTQPFAIVGIGMFNTFQNLTIGSVIIDGENTVSPAYNYGIMLRNITATINNSRFDGLCNGAYLRGFSVSDVYNTAFDSYVCPLTNTSTGSVKTNESATLNCYNCTMNDAENISAINASQVNVYWNLNILNPLNANINLYDLQNNLLSSFIGNNNIWVRQFFQNASGRTTTTPNSIQLSKSGYYPKNDSINMNANNNYIVSMRLIVPMINPASITYQLVLTLGFGIMGLFAVLTLFGFGYITATGKPDPEMIAKIMIGVVIIILMIVAVWTGIMTPP